MGIANINIDAGNSNSINAITGGGMSQAARASGLREILDRAVNAQGKEHVKEACTEFETYFLELMYKEMRKTADAGGIIPAGGAEKLFTEMLDRERASLAAKSGGVGLADMLYRQLTRDMPADPPQ